jgi:hypothetical protein
VSEVDRLIDEGLARYGAGDVDGALASWEQALALEPENPQASSYVDYVRQNYDVLATDAGTQPTDSSFAIESDPEYTIEISSGIEAPAHDPVPPDTDEGWFIDDDDPLTVKVGRAPSRDDPPRTLELEADEPPPPGGISFEETTREYIGNRPPPIDDPADEFGSEPSSFPAESTPVGFAAQETGVRARHTGFVKPVARPQPSSAARPAPPVPSPGGDPPNNSAELHVRVRTPSSMPAGKPATTPPPVDPMLGREPTTRDPVSLELEPLDLGLGEAGRAQPSTPPEAPPPLGEPTRDDLLGPVSPRRITPIRGSRGSVPPFSTEPEPPARIPTRDLPAPRPPARSGSPDVALAHAPTRDLAEDAPSDRDGLGDREANLASARGPIGGDDPVIGVPTRELGLRPPANKRAPSVFPDEDATTTQSDARQIRREAAAKVGDAVDASSAEILAEIDDGAPDDESKDDHVRRRISSLILRATEWNASGDLARAVTAADLALSEEPTSALAQKLVHRNRDAIMAVFQNYLGDLERQPQLAKPLHELVQTPIGSRAAFLLSRIDGMLSIDEILDVSGMPRLEAYRHLCQLFLRGILR